MASIYDKREMMDKIARGEELSKDEKKEFEDTLCQDSDDFFGCAVDVRDAITRLERKREAPTRQEVTEEIHQVLEDYGALTTVEEPEEGLEKKEEEEELTDKEMLKPAINLVQEYVQEYDVPPVAVTPGEERQVEDLAVDIDYRYTPLALYIKRQPEEYPSARGVIVINRPRLRCIVDNVPEWETFLHLTLLHEFAHHLDQFQPSAIPPEPSQETLEYLDTHHTAEEATEEEVRMWDFAWNKVNISVEEYVEIERKVVKALKKLDIGVERKSINMNEELP